MTPDEKEMQGNKIFIMKLAITFGVFMGGFACSQLVNIAVTLNAILKILQK